MGNGAKWLGALVVLDLGIGTFCIFFSAFQALPLLSEFLLDQLLRQLP